MHQQPVFGEKSLYSDWVAVSKQAADRSCLRYMKSWFEYRTSLAGKEMVVFHSSYGIVGADPSASHQDPARVSCSVHDFRAMGRRTTLDYWQLARRVMQQTALRSLTHYRAHYKPSRWLAMGWFGCVSKVSVYGVNGEYLPGEPSRSLTNVHGKFFQQS